MKNFGEILKESYQQKIPWKKQLSSMNGNSWGLYSGKVSDEAAKAMNKELSKLISNGFKKLAAGMVLIDQVAIDVYMDFLEFKKKYYDQGADTSEVKYMTKRIISDAFGVNKKGIF